MLAVLPFPALARPGFVSSCSFGSSFSMAGSPRVPASTVRVELPTLASAWAVVTCSRHRSSPAVNKKLIRSELTAYLAQWPCAVARAFLWAEQLGLHVPVDFSVRESRGADASDVVCPAVRSLCVALEVAAAPHAASPSPVYFSSTLDAVMDDVLALTLKLRRADALACPLPPEGGAGARASLPRGVASALGALSTLFRLPDASGVTGLAVVVWQPVFGTLSMFVGRSFWEYGGPPWRVLFLRLDDAASVPFLPLWANSDVDLQCALSLAAHLQVPCGLRCSYRLALDPDAAPVTADCHLGALLGHAHPRHCPRVPCMSWTGAFEEDTGPLAPLMLLSAPDENVPRFEDVRGPRPPNLARQAERTFLRTDSPRPVDIPPPKKKHRLNPARRRRAQRDPPQRTPLSPP